MDVDAILAELAQHVSCPVVWGLSGLTVGWPARQWWPRRLGWPTRS